MKNLVLMPSDLREQIPLLLSQCHMFNVPENNIIDIIEIIALTNIETSSILICDFNVENKQLTIDCKNQDGFMDYLKSFGYSMLFYSIFDEQQKNWIKGFYDEKV